VLGAGARCWSILQPKAKLTSKGLVSYRVLSKGAGLSYNQRLGVWCGGWVRCGYILHPSLSLVLGLVLRERIRCKGKGVKITNLNWIYLISYLYLG
jgi:hypothetical protein